MAQMQTLSIRLPDEDFQWLLSLQEAGARTPSEKLRALLQRIRQQETGLSDPERCAAWMRELVQAFVDKFAGLERQQKKHSDLISAVASLTPQIMATLVAAAHSDENGERYAVDIEAQLAQQSFRLLTTLLRAAVTSTPATYAPELYEKHLPDIIELAQIIDSRKGKETNHG